MFVAFVLPVISAVTPPGSELITVRAYAAEEDPGMRTLAFDVDVEVRENNSFFITERISVEFLRPGDGFVRTIMTRGWARMELGGKDIYYDVNTRISGINVTGGPYKAYREENELVGRMVITIGDPKTPMEGRHEFVISYLMSPDYGVLKDGGAGGESGEDEDVIHLGEAPKSEFIGSGGLPDQDFVHLFLIPSFWPTPIDSSSIRITFPKDADVSNAAFTAYEYGGVGFDNNLMDVQFLWPDADGTFMITAQALRPMDAGESLLFLVTLPKGYFISERTFSPFEIIFIAVAVAAPFFCVLIWFRFGRNRLIVETVELRPPAGLTPAETGLFWNGNLRDRDLYSMFLYWAGKGAIEIKETPDQDFILHKKTEDLPAGSKSFEKNMFYNIFSTGDQFSLKASALRAGKAMHGAREEILREFNKEQNLLYEKRSLIMRVIAFIIAFLPVVFNTIFAFSTAFWKFEASDFTAIIFLMVILLFLSINNRNGIESGKAEKPSGMKGGWEALKSPAAIISATVIGISVFVIVTSGVVLLQTPLHSIIAAVSTAACIVFAVRTRRRTEFYTNMLGQIRGFANFIKTAERDRIELLTREDPGYFFDILPYAWAMELTDEWESSFNKFDLKTMPPSVVVASPVSILDAGKDFK